ncbi:MAG TPA: hypothetical protein V6C71_00995 [Coleofasciculaceae cyanobacterium]|jgi:hypothetical protein
MYLKNFAKIQLIISCERNFGLGLGMKYLLSVDLIMAKLPLEQI